MKTRSHKPCTYCEKEFKLFKTTDKYCSRTCMMLGKRLKAYENKHKPIIKKKKSDRKLLMEIAVKVFHTHIKQRDKNEPCFCCGEPLGNDYHAGHCFSGGGHASVKFDEDNVHAQKAECNTGHRETLLDDMMVGCEKRIGKDAFEILRAKAYETKHWSVEDLEVIISRYKKLIEQE